MPKNEPYSDQTQHFIYAGIKLTVLDIYISSKWLTTQQVSEINIECTNIFSKTIDQTFSLVSKKKDATCVLFSKYAFFYLLAINSTKNKLQDEIKLGTNLIINDSKSKKVWTCPQSEIGKTFVDSLSPTITIRWRLDIANVNEIFTELLIPEILLLNIDVTDEWKKLNVYEISLATKILHDFIINETYNILDINKLSLILNYSPEMLIGKIQKYQYNSIKDDTKITNLI